MILLHKNEQHTYSFNAVNIFQQQIDLGVKNDKFKTPNCIKNNKTKTSVH